MNSKEVAIVHSRLGIKMKGKSKMKNRLVLVLLLLPLVYRCGGHVPDIHYYLIDFKVASQEVREEPAHRITLGVARFDATPLYQESRLVYRAGPYEANYYHYHRWISSPAQMVTDKTIEQLLGAQLFAQVVPFPKHSQVDYVLQGTIKALEELDEGEQWYARVQLAFELIDNQTQRVVWQKTMEQKRVLAEKNPSQVVAGINWGVHQCLQELERALRGYFSK